MRKNIHSCFLVFVLLQCITISASYAQGSEMYEPIAQFEADERALSRTYNIHESTEYYERMTKLYDSWNKSISDMDFDAMSAQGQADYVLLKNLVEKRLYFLNIEHDKFDEISQVLEVAEPLYAFVKSRRHGAVPEYKKLAASFASIAEKLKTEEESLKKEPFENWLVAQKASDAVESLKRSLDEAYHFYYAYDPQFTWWMEEPYKTLEIALGTYSEFLKENYNTTSIKDDGSGIIGKPIGEKAIRKSLSFSMIPYGPEELIKAAEEQFQYCEAEMLKASKELGFGKDWKAALEYVKNTYVPPAEQPKLIDSLAWEATAFVENNDLITVPEMAKETWRMIMMTPERQKVNPFFTGGEVISISYPTNTMSHEDKMMSMRGNNPNFSSATVHHELIPGHHMQQYMNQRYKPYRRIFWTPFWTEGWSLYWEINLWNKQFPDTPEEKIGMLFWRMHRCARIIFSLSYHLNKMTPQECIDMLVDRVGHEYANAEAEVRRSFVGGYDPLYQVAYMIGGLQFFALQKELTAQGWTEKQYHDAVMKEGNMPIEILRSILMKKKLDKNFKTKWKFSTDFR
ncbi:DUF885 domain-containing protein [Fulvivirga maritima]|uniref:DUF885 family protein n=1 Tax=Fulvivirga maritima TaxID=2904247 RepID=UPI001F15E965|nr:DUF885 family protein [Fulvivirga maritima]UII26183.1 DUF885 domain-containing protein [Fulvivirga maritima]